MTSCHSFGTTKRLFETLIYYCDSNVVLKPSKAFLNENKNELSQTRLPSMAFLFLRAALYNLFYKNSAIAPACHVLGI
jgi:hypothetical protein